MAAAPVRARLDGVLAAIRRLGGVDTALMLVDRALARVSGGRARLHKYVFMAQRVPPAPLTPARATGIVVEELRGGDPRLDRLERPADELAHRFDRSARCFAAWQGDALTGFLWFTDRGYDEDEVRCTFRVDACDRAVWDFDVHIVPRYRLGRTFALLWDSAFAAMRARGVRWSVSRVSAFKADSIRAHQRLGARPVGWAVFLLFGSTQFTLTSPGRLKCRWLEQGPYPVLDVRVPAEAGTTVDDDAPAAEALAGRAGPPR
jgi:hypothetical protein